jgi:hypothetical protein
MAFLKNLSASTKDASEADVQSATSAAPLCNEAGQDAAQKQIPSKIVTKIGDDQATDQDD